MNSLIEKLNKIPVVLLVIITLLFAKLQANKHLMSDKDICFNICSDARGYYAWLPAIFIHHDLNFKFFEEVELKESCGGPIAGCVQDYRVNFEGKICNKYYPGSSFMMLPFFTVAHLWTKAFTDYAADGYSPIYFKVMGMAGIFYYFLGMFILLKIFDKLKLNTLQKSLALIFITFGTNMMYYAVDKPTYSHMYSFALINAFLFVAFRLKERFTAKDLTILSFLLGWIFVSRPVNISIAVVLPFMFWSDRMALWTTFKSTPQKFLGVLAGLIMPLVLLSLYKISTGSFLVYSYDEEGFNFMDPYFWHFMFHYEAGLFLYMPLLLLPVLLFWTFWHKNDAHLIIGAALTLLLTIYIHSSWWCWTYGSSFGTRTILDFVGLFGVLIALLLKQENYKRYYYIIPLCMFCTSITALLYHQMHNGFLYVHPITDYWQALLSPFGFK